MAISASGGETGAGEGWQRDRRKPRTILLTGGTGVIGRGLIPALLDAGHRVRLLSRHADDGAGDWPGGRVEPWPADVADAAAVAGSADGCDAVIHVAGITREASLDMSFERINVEGTRHVVREAERAGVRRFLFASSLGADRGGTGYHRSKRAAEAIVARFAGSWTVLRPGNVYGPGDEVISSLLVLVRTLPALPVVGDGGQRFQPVWYRDLGDAIARCLERDDLAGRTLELAGDDVTTLNDLLDRLERLEGRTRPRLPIPTALADLGARVAEGMSLGRLLERVTGLDIPLDSAKLGMLQEENVVRDPAGNGLTHVLGISPVPLEEGLRRLAQELPERLPAEGVGPLERRRFSALIHRGRLGPEALMDALRRESAVLLPLDFLDTPPDRPLRPGDTLRLRLQGRGHAAVRVEETEPRHLTLATLRGHPLAGVVRFAADDDGPHVRFAVEIHARAAGLYDLFLMRAAGDGRQRSTWEEAVLRVVDRSGGVAPAGVEEERAELDGDGAGTAERWIERLVRGRRPAGD